MPRRLLRYLVRALAVILVLVVVVGVATEMGRYVARAAWAEGKILARRRPISDLLADTTTRREVAAKLRVVQSARAFAVRELGLVAEESFTTYSPLDRDTLVLVVSAARRDSLVAKTWWFPIVGRFPYKGFFDFAQAKATAASLRAQSLDTYVRPASAFSTLGWFNDPLLSTTLALDSTDLAATVIHELVHNTLFVKGHVAFNESFASFVGARGAAAFFRGRSSDRAARRVEIEWEDDKLLGAFWETTAHKIDSVFAVPGRDSTERINARDSVYARMRRVLLDDLAPRMPTVSAERLERIQLDNASLLARRVYASDLYLFDEVHRRAGGTLRQTIDLVRGLVRDAEDPYGSLREWVAGTISPTPTRGFGS
ncbi:MAG: aminopeptidase [Gemmatimonadaceae bacterium]